MFCCQLGRTPQIQSPQVILLSFSWDFSAFPEAACRVVGMCGVTGLFPTRYLKASSQIIPSTAASVRVLQLVLVDTFFAERTQLCTENKLSARWFQLALPLVQWGCWKTSSPLPSARKTS